MNDFERHKAVRTKAALAAAKRRGVKLGSSRPGHWESREQKRHAGLRKAQQAASKARTEAFESCYSDLYPVVQEMRSQEHSLQKIADHLNEVGHTTRRGMPWNRM